MSKIIIIIILTLAICYAILGWPHEEVNVNFFQELGLEIMKLVGFFGNFSVIHFVLLISGVLIIREVLK